MTYNLGWMEYFVVLRAQRKRRPTTDLLTTPFSVKKKTNLLTSESVFCGPKMRGFMARTGAGACMA